MQNKEERMSEFKAVDRIPKVEKKGVYYADAVRRFADSADRIWERECSEMVEDYRERNKCRAVSDSIIINRIASCYRSAVMSLEADIKVMQRGTRIYLVKE